MCIITARAENIAVVKRRRLEGKNYNFERAVILSGDGDFLPVLKYLKSVGKEVIVLGRAERTVKEIKQFAGENLRDFQYPRERIKVREK